MRAFRDSHRYFAAHEALRELRASFARGDALEALLRAAELEGALADAACEPALDVERAGEAARAERESARWTDAAADALVADRQSDDALRLDRIDVDRGDRRGPAALESAEVGALRLRASVPEGFAYYALHPLDYARAAAHAVPGGASALVIGVRTIGTALSAVAAAALRARGVRALRATVRPSGDPFDRRVALPEPLARDVRRAAVGPGVLALIADEGPGLSGSSFLAVADALVAAGMPRERVVLLPSHAPDPIRLRAPDGARRWTALRSVVAEATHAIPGEAALELGGGAWRDRRWPAAPAPGAARPLSWPAMERRKYLDVDRSAVLKFEGLAHFGARALERGERLAARGIGPPVRAATDGFLRWQLAPGRPMSLADRPPLDAIARAIAARAEIAPVAAGIARESTAAISAMARDDVASLLAREIARADWPHGELPLAVPVVADGRMMPHEWIADAGGDRVLKVDAVSHGDDHFYPGPCDVAWDLAGAVVEWELDAAHAGALVDRYVRASGDRDARARMPAWTIAYVAFRAAWLATARDACAGTAEHAPLARAAARMRRRLARLLARPARERRPMPRA